jgi:hypothetical protein
MVTEIASELQERKQKRGMIAQLKTQVGATQITSCCRGFISLWKVYRSQ